MNVVVYTRTAGPNPAGYSWQRDACHRLAMELGCEVTRTYSDDDRSRPAFDRLVADIEAGNVSTLLVARYDRLTRSSVENQRLTRVLRDTDVDVYAANIGPRKLNDPTTYHLQVVAAMQPSEIAEDVTPWRADVPEGGWSHPLRPPFLLPPG